MSNQRKFDQLSPDSEDSKSQGNTKKHKNEIIEAIQGVREELIQQMRSSEERSSALINSKFDALEISLGTKILKLEEKVDALEDQINTLKQENEGLVNKVNQMDKQGRRLNIKITGMETNNTESALNEINRSIMTATSKPIAVKDIRIMETKRGKRIFATCQSMEDKRVIMANKKNMKTQDGKPMYVDQDLTKEESEIFYKCRKEAENHKKSGANVKVQSNRIQVNGEWMYYDKQTESFIHRKKFRDTDK